MNDVNKAKNLSIEALKVGLDNYLNRGYIVPNSFEAPEDEAFNYLMDLSLKDDMLTLMYCKKILESLKVTDDYLKSICLYRLLVSENDYLQGFKYIDRNSLVLSIAELKKVLEFLVYGKNDPEMKYLPTGLLKKLKARYQEVRNYPDAKFYHLDEIYNDYIKAYSIS